MADEPIKRLRYFTGQFLEAADLTAEQNYHVGLRRRGNRALYLAGILDGGFGVTYLPADRKIQISPGIGVDAQGRELVVVNTLTESPPATGTYFVTLTYQEIETDLQSQTGADAVSEKTRFDETPKVRFFPDGTSIDKDTFIVIAKITVDNTGNVSGIDPSVRQNGHLKTRYIDGKDWRNDTKDDLFLNWNTGKNVQLGFGENTKSSLFVSGNVGIGTTGPISGKLQFDNSLGNKVVVWDGGATDRYGLGLNGSNLNAFVPAGARFSVRQNGFDGTEVMTVTGTGSVGIGIPNPTAKLQVTGGAIMPAAGNSSSAGIQFPSDPGGGGGDAAFIRYYAESGETTKLLIGCTNDADDRITFYQFGAERLTIYDGKVGIGMLSPARTLDIDGSMRATGEIQTTSGNAFRLVQGGYGCFLRNDGSSTYVLLTSSGNQYGSWNGLRPLTINNASGDVWLCDKLYVNNNDGSVTVNGNIGTSGYDPNHGGHFPPGWGGGVHTFDVVCEATVGYSALQQWSSIREKENIKYLSNVLDRLENLNPARFDRKPEYHNGTKGNLGFIAEEVREIFPELVNVNEDKGFFAASIRTDGMLALAIAGIKELSQRLRLLQRVLPGETCGKTAAIANESISKHYEPPVTILRQNTCCSGSGAEETYVIVQFQDSTSGPNCIQTRRAYQIPNGISRDLFLQEKYNDWRKSVRSQSE